MSDIYDRLEDGVWLRDGEEIEPEQMTPDHRANLLSWLRSRAESLKTSYEYMAVSGPIPRGDAACDAFDDGLDQLLEQDAQEWLDEFPLVQRLEELTGERAS